MKIVFSKQMCPVGLLKPKEAAHILNVHENTLRRWCDRGIITCYRVNERGDRRVALDEVNALSSRMHDHHGCV